MCFIAQEEENSVFYFSKNLHGLALKEPFGTFQTQSESCYCIICILEIFRSIFKLLFMVYLSYEIVFKIRITADWGSP